MKSLLIAILASTVVVVTAAGPEQKYKTPRTENGQPDLQGVWNFSSEVPFERPASAADKKMFTKEEADALRFAKQRAFAMISTVAPVEAVTLDWLDYATKVDDLRTSRIAYPENGKLPKLVDGVRRSPGVDEIIAALADSKGAIPPALAGFLGGGKKDGHDDLSLAERCLGGTGVPLSPGFDNNYLHIIQSKDHVAFVTEAAHSARIVPLDGRPYLRETFRSWTGDSRGHWEGDTLVVETRTFNKRSQSFAGAGSATEKVVTERFTRSDKNVLSYEATVVDPKTFQDKVVVAFPMGKLDGRVYEVACHEGNYAVPNILAGARAEERAAAAVK